MEPLSLTTLLLLQLLLQLQVFLPFLFQSLSLQLEFFLPLQVQPPSPKLEFFLLVLLYPLPLLFPQVSLSHARGFSSSSSLPSFGSVTSLASGSNMSTHNLRRRGNISRDSLRGSGSISLFGLRPYIRVSYELLSFPPLLEIIDAGLLLGKQPLRVFQLRPILRPLLLQFLFLTLEFFKQRPLLLNFLFVTLHPFQQGPLLLHLPLMILDFLENPLPFLCLGNRVCISTLIESSLST